VALVKILESTMSPGLLSAPAHSLSFAVSRSRLPSRGSSARASWKKSHNFRRLFGTTNHASAVSRERTVSQDSRVGLRSEVPVPSTGL
jgi:hypothetical protein